MKTTLLLIISFLVIGFTKAEEPSVHLVSTAGYRFELNSIERQEDGSLVCKLLVSRMHVHTKVSHLTLLRSDRRGTTKLFDENGNDHVPQSIRVNDNRNRFENYIGLDLELGWPVRVAFNVPDFDPEISMVSKFEVAFSARDYGEFVVTFRNIKIK